MSIRDKNSLKLFHSQSNRCHFMVPELHRFERKHLNFVLFHIKCLWKVFPNLRLRTIIRFSFEAWGGKLLKISKYFIKMENRENEKEKWVSQIKWPVLMFCMICFHSLHWNFKWMCMLNIKFVCLLNWNCCAELQSRCELLKM